MKKLFAISTLSLAIFLLLNAQKSAFNTNAYKIGDKVTDFTLKNIDGKMMSLKDLPATTKGVILVFTCNHCPFSKYYEDRIIALDAQYKPKNYPVVAINPNDPKREPDDSFENMALRAKDKGFTFPYLVDGTQEIAKTYGATNTPHLFILEKKGADFFVRYIGAIDDSAKDAKKVSNKYAETALNELLEGKK